MRKIGRVNQPQWSAERKISHGVYLSHAEGFEMTGALLGCHLRTDCVDAP